MPIRLLGPFNRVINETMTEVINGGIVHKAEDIVVTVINSSVSLIDDALVKVQSLTAPDSPPEP